MRPTLSNYLILTLFAIVYWAIAMGFFLLSRYIDLSLEPGIILKKGSELTVKDISLISLIVGLLLGIPYAGIEVTFDRILHPRISAGLAILIRTISYLILLIFTLSAMMEFVESIWAVDLPNERGWWRTNRLFWVFVAYFGIFSIFFSFLKVARERFGRRTLFGILLGRYSKPKEEDRIFMFLDLRSSTTIAEQIGSLSYSELIRDCFLDLDTIITKFDAEIYQYVGDEAVLSWKYNRGLWRNNCVALFFEFQKKLQHRSPYYQHKYGLLPEFKAGLHGGKLVIVEVGSVKKELAYHGDVINTTARIQDQCNRYGEDLLISENLLQYLNLGKEYKLKEIGNLVLKGKTEQLKLYAIREIKKSLNLNTGISL